MVLEKSEIVTIYIFSYFLITENIIHIQREQYNEMPPSITQLQ